MEGDLLVFDKLLDKKKHDILLIMVHPCYPWMPPLGLAYVSTYLRNNGYQPLVYDFNAKLYNSVPAKKRKLWDVSTISELPEGEIVRLSIEDFSSQIDKLVELLIERPEPIVGFSVYFLNVYVASLIAERIKKAKPDKLIIFGGPGCFWDYDRKRAKEGAVDIFVIGEGERPLFEIVDNFYKGGDIYNIRGTVAYKNGSYVDNTPPNPVLDLDRIPYPTFEEFNLGDYGGWEKDKTLPILISRGCISKCSFCVDYIMCNPFRIRSAKNVLEELEYHVKVNGISNFSFNDLLCNGHLKRLEEICDLIIQRGLKIKWGSYAMARGDMSFELLRKMKQAGCTTICYGIESGSNRVLKLMGKLYTAEDAERVLRLTHRAGIKATFNIIIGHPGEGEKEFMETLDFVRRNKDYIDSIINVSTCFINPKSKLGMEPQRYGMYFPRTPRSFKFVRVMKFLFPKYYKIFGESIPIDELKGIDSTEFVDTKGNTKPDRLNRLVKTLKLIQELNLFKEDPIINVYPTNNKRVKRTIEQVSKRWTIEGEDFALRCNYKGFAEVLYRNELVTRHPGLNIAFLINGRWIDTSLFNWEIRKIGKRKLKVEIDNNGIVQIWNIKLIKDGFEWEIKGRLVDNSMGIPQEIKVILFLPGAYRYWIALPYAGEYPPFDLWRAINVGQVNTCLVCPDEGHRAMCQVNFELKESSCPLFLRIENSDKKSAMRAVVFKGSYMRGVKWDFYFLFKIGVKPLDLVLLERLKNYPSDLGVETFFDPSKWSEEVTPVR